MAKSAAKPALKVVPKKEPELSEKIDRLVEIRAIRAPLDKQSGDLKKEFDSLKLSVLETLGERKEIRSGTAKATVSITENDVPVIIDKVKLLKWVIRHEKFFMFTEGMSFSTPIWRDERDKLRESMKNKKTEVPGTATFTKIDLSVTALKSE